MKLSENELNIISQWKPLLNLFRDGEFKSEEDICENELERFVNRLRAHKWLRVEVLEKGMYGSYYSIFLSSDLKDIGEVEGVQVNLSVLVPYAVIGRTKMHFFKDARGSSLLDYDELASPKNINCRISKVVKNCLGSTCYKLVEPYEMDAVLPVGISPMDYCTTKKPWNRLFHIIFQATD